MCINSIKLLWPGIRYTQKGVYSCAKIDVRLMGWDREGGTDRTLFTKVALLHIWHHDCYSLYLLVVYNFLIVLNVVYIASLVLSCVRYFTHLISKKCIKVWIVSNIDFVILNKNA